MASLIIRDPVTKKEKMNLSTRLPRILGKILVIADGSLKHDGFLTGTPVARVMYAGDDPDAVGAYLPFASFSGDTMSWAFPASSAGPSMIVYMVY